MKRSKNIVDIHIILGAICSLPLLLTVVTGIFLILRSHTTYMQPKAMKLAPLDSFETLINPGSAAKVAQIPEGEINSMIYKPKKGIIQVRTNDGFEYHLNAKNGQIINSGPKRTSFFIRLHEGSYFGPKVRDYVFFPSAVIFLISLLTGIYLSFFWIKRKLVSKQKKSYRRECYE